MKPVIDDLKCGAGKEACKVISLCPTEAISWIEVEEALDGRIVGCESDGCCSCGCEEESDCGTNPYARIVIDPEKCIECGLCVAECCGQAITME